MNLKRIFAGALALCLGLGAVPNVRAAQVDSGDVYCFSQEDFSREDLAGICLTGVTPAAAGELYLGSRVLRPGDVLTVSQARQLTFRPRRTEEDTAVTVSYLPVFSTHVDQPESLTISVRGRENLAPVAEDFAAETYKNLPLEGKLKVKDPENEAMTYTLVRGPRRGQVELRTDGSFLYTPKKNKVGIDSFVYTASDASGKVSRETTVTITIVKPTDATQYTDTLGRDCRFSAEWMKNTGIFVGEKLDGNACFHPDRTVTRGEFVAMLVKTLEIPAEQTAALERLDAPQWLRPYLNAALRSGLMTALEETPDHFDQPISGAEAAMMIQNALELPRIQETAATQPLPELSNGAAQILADYGICLEDVPLTREAAAQALYRTSQLLPDAPGMVVLSQDR